jgi:hypothetical protein
MVKTLEGVKFKYQNIVKRIKACPVRECPIRALHIPEPDEDMGKLLKAQPMVYRWTNGAGWVTTSYKVMKMKAINH